MPAFVVVIGMAMFDGGRCFVEDLAPTIGAGHVVEGVEGLGRDEQEGSDVLGRKVEGCVGCVGVGGGSH